MNNRRNYYSKLKSIGNSFKAASLILALSMTGFTTATLANQTSGVNLTGPEKKFEAGKFCCTGSTKTGGTGCYESTTGSCPTTHYTIHCTGNTTLSPTGPKGTGTLSCGKPTAKIKRPSKTIKRLMRSKN